MRTLAGVFKYEYRMMIARRGLWLADAVFFAFFLAAALRLFEPALSPFSGAAPWKAAGEMLFTFNLFAPLIAGIAAADRLVRDDVFRVRELQRGSPLSGGILLAGKAAGVLAAALTPNLLFLLGVAVWMILAGVQSAAFLPAALAGFAAITVPAFAFVVAFSLACPLVMPVRIYQVLFIGYWFWGNYLPPEVFPTLNGTLLTPSGVFASREFFGGRSGPVETPAMPGETALNLAVLFAAVFVVLGLAARFRAWKEKDA